MKIKSLIVSLVLCGGVVGLLYSAEERSENVGREKPLFIFPSSVSFDGSAKKLNAEQDDRDRDIASLREDFRADMELFEQELKKRRQDLDQEKIKLDQEAQELNSLPIESNNKSFKDVILQKQLRKKQEELKNKQQQLEHSELLLDRYKSRFEEIVKSADFLSQSDYLSRSVFMQRELAQIPGVIEREHLMKKNAEYQQRIRELESALQDKKQAFGDDKNEPISKSWFGKARDAWHRFTGKKPDDWRHGYQKGFYRVPSTLEDVSIAR